MCENLLDEVLAESAPLSHERNDWAFSTTVNGITTAACVVKGQREIVKTSIGLRDDKVVCVFHTKKKP